MCVLEGGGGGRREVEGKEMKQTVVINGFLYPPLFPSCFPDWVINGI